MVDENTGYLPVDDRINAIQNLATDRMIMTQAGFLEIFVNNDAQTPVYYDNMTVTRSSGPSMDVYAYYPFGMLIPGLSDFNLSVPNSYRYSAKEIQAEMELQWYDHGARMLGTTFSRWMTPDPLAGKYYHISPYAFCGNNPINAIDPDGKAFFLLPAIPLIVKATAVVVAKVAAGAVVDAGIQYGAQRIAGKSHSDAVRNIDVSSIVTSGVVSGIGAPGVSNAVKTAVKAGAVLLDAAVDVTFEKGLQYVGGSDGNNKSIENVVTDAVTGGMGVLGTNPAKGVLGFVEGAAQESLVGASGALGTGVKKVFELDDKQSDKGILEDDYLIKNQKTQTQNFQLVSH